LISFFAIGNRILKAGRLIWIKPSVAFRQESPLPQTPHISLWHGSFRRVMLTIHHMRMIDPATVACKSDEISQIKTFLANTLNKALIFLSVGWPVSARHRGFLGWLRCKKTERG
jgi:hypothetical protein